MSSSERSRSWVVGKGATVMLAATTLLIGLPKEGRSQVTSANSDEPTVVAEGLESRAYDLTLGTGWASAEPLYRRAVELRGMGDPQSAENTQKVGVIQYYDGRLRAAVHTHQEAGEAFLALGDVERAATAFIDGAWIANRAGLSSDAHALRERGRLLTNSPLLETETLAVLFERLGAEPFVQ